MKTNMENKVTRTIFCANEQEDLLHELSFTDNGEVMAKCPKCGRVVKFPAGLTKEQFTELVVKHKTANQGQITQEALQKALSEFADEVDTGEEKVVPTDPNIV